MLTCHPAVWDVRDPNLRSQEEPFRSVQHFLDWAFYRPMAAGTAALLHDLHHSQLEIDGPIACEARHAVMHGGIDNMSCINLPGLC